MDVCGKKSQERCTVIYLVPFLGVRTAFLISLDLLAWGLMEGEGIAQLIMLA